MIEHELRQTYLWHNREDSWLESTTVHRPTPVDTSGDTLIVEAIASQVSLGTERRLLLDTLPETVQQAMRVPYMQGTFDQAFTYGYSLVGKVLEGPASWLGKRVHLLHPHQRIAVVKTADAVVLPDALDTDTATLISNMETAVNALWDARPAVGDQVNLFGYGLIGTLVAALLRQIPGLQLTIVEPDPARAALAEQSGLQVNPTDRPPEQVDIAISTAANADALQGAIESLRPEGTALELGFHGGQSVPLYLGGTFHYERKRLVSSQVSRIPLDRAHWDWRRRKFLVIQLLLDCQHLPSVEQRIRFDETPEFYTSLRTTAPSARHIVIDY